ncbi:nerve growth factor receptor b [Denticeps clupeoides]|uniref:Uncharacterized protein n=1 Tax=Denticeps clupeoides TaxID=299321 RepID=A0AAY4AG39_9TELE|nr:tumor necrosis factor receptor superfamily member 16-like [Denticeps clupeoides]
MIYLVFAVLLATRGVAGTQCNSGKYTTNRTCCKECPPGEGVVEECGEKDTVCAPCIDSETFSENFSATEKCQRCTRCTGLMRMDTPCTDTNDAVCVCDYGYYLNSRTNKCTACTVCPKGSGVLYRCNPDRDTTCESCIDDTFSDQETALDPCMPCNVCEENEVQLTACTQVSDTECQALNAPNASSPTSTFTTQFPSPPTPSVTFAPVPDDDPTKTTTNQDYIGKGLIPVYCSILAAVVVSIVAFVIFKTWNSCKKNKQGGNNRACAASASMTPSPEGEKLHSDSGISVDSQSLQEQLQQAPTHTVIKIDGGQYLAMPLHACEEVEKLLQGSEEEGHGATEETDWCNLAGLLGYGEERIATFRQEERPIQALLSDWSSRDSASVDSLCTALKKINRDDIVQSLMAKPTATSSV